MMSREGRRRSRNRVKGRKLPTVLAGGLAGGAAIAAGTQAYADPIGFRSDTPVVTFMSGESLAIDVNFDGWDDLGFGYVGQQDYTDGGYWEVWTDLWGAIADGLNGARIISQADDLGPATTRFAEGALIGPGGTTGPLNQETNVAAFYRYRYYNWLYGYDRTRQYSDGSFENNRGFLGFKFSFLGQEHWGWVESNVNHASYNPYQGALEIYGWGFETSPNTAIAAGAVPEPGSLAALAFGAAAVAGRRRKSNG